MMPIPPFPGCGTWSYRPALIVKCHWGCCKVYTVPHGWHLKGAVTIGVIYDPVNSREKGCLHPISATSFHSDSHLGGRDYCLEGEKKSCVPIIEQVAFKKQPGEALGCGILENIAQQSTAEASKVTNCWET